jgi:cobyrinic acid a,c-diamide synthase
MATVARKASSGEGGRQRAVGGDLMVRDLPRIVVAGTASGVGKTTVATGLMAALAEQGLRVAGFKVGPDYIDPSYHALATGMPPRNLDAFLCGPELMAPLLAHGASDAGIAVIEGVMGLFDGASGTTGLASTAHVATLLDAPVLLVVDAGGMARSVAAMVHGYATFEPAVRIAGVVINRLGSPRHAELVREALAPLGIPVVGTLLRDAGLETPSRHLGLVPAGERVQRARTTIDALGSSVGAALDLDLVQALARSAPPLACDPWAPPERGAGRAGIAVAAGPAFTFTYTENLELLSAAGGEIMRFDPLRDERLPDGTDALYLGGGFPEMHGAELAANVPLRSAVAAHAAAGRPIIAECGGMLYLSQTLDGHPQCGVIAADAMTEPRLHLGYRTAEVATATPWWSAGTQARAHEFHHAVLDPDASRTPAWQIGQRVEGFVARNLHASWLHTHWGAMPDVAHRFVATAAKPRTAALCT